MAGKGLWGEPHAVSGTAAASPALDLAVYVSRTGRKYHRSDCPHLRRGRTAIQLSEARKHYVPCTRCQPPL